MCDGVNWIASSLWDLIAPLRKREPAPPRKPARRKVARPAVTPLARPVERAAVSSGVQARYDALVEEMKQTYGVRVRKWRKSSSGVAYEVRYRNGEVAKSIEAPYPRGPVSCAIFLHEIGHHAIGLGVHRPRCLEEYVVWVWAISQMRARGLNVTPAVEKRFRDSMRYAVAKARRRGLKQIPAELAEFL